VESILLTNSNKTKFHAASVRSSDYSTYSWTGDDDHHDVVVQRRSIVYTDGRPGTLRCVAVALASPLRVHVYLGRRNVTGELRATHAVTAGGRPGMRLLRYHVELVRHDFRPSVDDAGRRLTCTAFLEDDRSAANATSARLVVRRESVLRFVTTSEIIVRFRSCSLMTILIIDADVDVVSLRAQANASIPGLENIVIFLKISKI